MGANWIAKWEGGRIRTTSTGKRVWVIERGIGGKPYSISLKATTEREAVSELVVFERDPMAYLAARDRPAALDSKPLLVDAALIDRFADWARDDGRDPEYVRDILHKYLTEWSERLRGRDLRTISTLELRQVLAGWKRAKPHRVVALKSLTAWLRGDAALLNAQNDPTLGLHSISKRKGKRADDEGKAYSAEEVEAVYRAVEAQYVRDLITLGVKTALHQKEIARFARGNGRLRRVGPWEGCPIVGTLRVQHKTRDPHTVSLDAQCYAAAERLRAAGGRSRSWVYQQLKTTSERYDVPHLLLGSLRHSFVTLCRTPGLGVEKAVPPRAAISLEDVAAITGHRTTSTTRHFYDEADAVPFMMVLPLRLFHPDDPRS